MTEMNVFGHATFVGNTGYNAHSKNFFRNLSKYCNLKLRNYTVGPNWDGIFKGDKCHGDDVTELDKEFICLQTLWDQNTLKAFPIFKRGIEDFKYNINLVLAEANHYYFYDNYAGPKIAYTVWETTKYYQPFFDKLKQYDQIWVPTSWQAQITINQGADPNKVKVVPEGVDSSIFFPENFKPHNKFRFIMFGRWDNRKSTKEIIAAFKKAFGYNDKVELLISVDDSFNSDGLGSTLERLKHYDLLCPNIKILNFVKKEDYPKYLKAGHVFLSCSRSEGWNLPLIEAMACGTPSIYSDCSGQLEFAKGKGIPVKIKGEIESARFYKPTEAAFGNWYEPDFKDLEEKMVEVYNNYQYYKDKALVESKEIRERFTWDNAAKNAIDLISECVGQNPPEFSNTIPVVSIDMPEKLKSEDEKAFEEIFDYNTYEKFCRVQVEDGDVVLDLGCSKGYFYFKHKDKNIKYYGVDASSQGIKDFYELLKPEDKPVVINALIENKKAVTSMKHFFHKEKEESLVVNMSFCELMNMMPVKVNFLKFDIEGGEKEFLGDEAGYEMFKRKVEKFSGEIHLKGGTISREEAMLFLKKLKEDKDLICKIYSCDGFDIDFYFWSDPNKYDQVIVSGLVKKNSRHESFELTPSSDPVSYYIVNESPSLGDIIAWVPMVDKFQREKASKVKLYTPFAELFQSAYPNINFDFYNAQPKNNDSVIRLGTFDMGGKKWSEYNLQELAAKILGVEYEPTKCKIATPNKPKNNFTKKYVCIATQSTAQFKYWNNPDGWQKTVDYLNSLGYDVVCIDKHPVFGVEGSMNSIPKNCIDKTGDLPLSDRINDLIHCDFFIGLTSGLSWLAWSLGKPVVFISGISLPHTDFPTPYRVTNMREGLCHGCASKPDFTFNKNDWNFCPENKNFECTREISFEMVKEKIDLLMVRENFEHDFSIIDARVSFKGGATIEITDTTYPKYLIHLYVYYGGEWIIYHHSVDFAPNQWFKGMNTKRRKWRWKVFAFEGDNLKLVFQHTYNEKGRVVEFVLDSESSMYDKAYVEKAIKFEKENECIVFVKSKYHEKLKKEFPDFGKILPLEENIFDVYASYEIKRHDIETKRENYWRTNKVWQYEGQAEITVDHTENWIEYPQEKVFEDIVNYE